MAAGGLGLKILPYMVSDLFTYSRARFANLHFSIDLAYSNDGVFCIFLLNHAGRKCGLENHRLPNAMTFLAKK